MLNALLQRLKRTPPVTIPDHLWSTALAALPFVERLDGGERVRLRALAEQLLADKQMAGAADLVLTPAMQVNIAVQASLPVLNLGLDWYRGWKSIVVYPSEFLVPRSVTDEDGVVHEYVEPITGEAWDRGPLVLSWEDAQINTRAGVAYSVVIHEFVHKMDLLNGDADGVPPFSSTLHKGLTVERWRSVLCDAFDRFTAEVDLIESEIPADVDPESDEVDRYFANLPFDTYAAQDESEFFAVTSEAFFVGANGLQQAFPDWYGLLSQFFRQDPLAAA